MGLVLGSQPGATPVSGKNPQQQAQPQQAQSGKNPTQGAAQGASHPAVQQLMQHLTTHMQSQGGQAPTGGKNPQTSQQASPAKPAQAKQPQAGGKNLG